MLPNQPLALHSSRALYPDSFSSWNRTSRDFNPSSDIQYILDPNHPHSPSPHLPAPTSSSYLSHLLHSDTRRYPEYTARPNFPPIHLHQQQQPPAQQQQQQQQQQPQSSYHHSSEEAGSPSSATPSPSIAPESSSFLSHYGTTSQPQPIHHLSRHPTSPSFALHPIAHAPYERARSFAESYPTSSNYMSSSYPTANFSYNLQSSSPMPINRSSYTATSSMSTGNVQDASSATPRVDHLSRLSMISYEPYSTSTPAQSSSWPTAEHQQEPPQQQQEQAHHQEEVRHQEHIQQQQQAQEQAQQQQQIQQQVHQQVRQQEVAEAQAHLHQQQRRPSPIEVPKLSGTLAPLTIPTRSPTSPTALLSPTATSPPPSTSGTSSSPQESKTYAFVALPGNAVKKRPRRKYDEIERLYSCSHPGCIKSYGTLNHLNAHITMQRHGQKRSPLEFKELRKIWRRQKQEESPSDAFATSSASTSPIIPKNPRISGFRARRVTDPQISAPPSSLIHQASILPPHIEALSQPNLLRRRDSAPEGFSQHHSPSGYHHEEVQSPTSPDSSTPSYSYSSVPAVQRYQHSTYSLSAGPASPHPPINRLHPHSTLLTPLNTASLNRPSSSSSAGHMVSQQAVHTQVGMMLPPITTLQEDSEVRFGGHGGQQIYDPYATAGGRSDPGGSGNAYGH